MANFTNIRFTRFFGKSLFFAMIMVSFAMVSFGQKTTISDGNWSNPAIWSPSGVPAVGADVTINNNVILDVNPPALKKVKVNQGASLRGPNSITIQNSSNNSFTDLGDVRINSLTMSTNADVTVDGKLILSGSFNFSNRNVKGSGYVSAAIYNTTNKKVFGRTPVNGEIICGLNWDGSETSSWSGIPNWTSDEAASNVPTATSYVSIHSATNQPVISSAITVKELVINTGNVTLTVNGGSSLTVTDTTVILSTDGLKLLSPGNSGAPGSFITNFVSGSGSAIAERYILGYSSYPQGQQADHGWHTLSSPVQAQSFTSGNFYPGTYDDLYLWSEPTDMWINIKSSPEEFGSYFVTGKGYLCAYQNSTPVKSFSGILNGNSDVNITGLTNSSTNLLHNGWNLVGNPFPSAMTWNINATGWNKQNIDNVAKVWNEVNASYSDINTNAAIPAMQGFMVHVNNVTGGSFTIPKSAKVHSTQNFYKEEETNVLMLTVIDAASATAQESVIKLNENATEGYDPDLDSYFAPGYAPKLYSILSDDELLSTNALPLNENGTTVQMGFEKVEGMDYTIEATGIESFAPGTIITLEDLQSGNSQVLNDNPVYAFTITTDIPQGRFVIHFDRPVAVGNTPAERPFTVYAHGSVITVAAPAGVPSYDMNVTDMTGRVVYSGKVNTPGKYNAQLNVSNGVYVVDIVTGSTSISKKVMICN